MEDFFEEYVAAPVTQKPCLCSARTASEGERGGKGRENNFRKWKKTNLELNQASNRVLLSAIRKRRADTERFITLLSLNHKTSV